MSNLILSVSITSMEIVIIIIASVIILIPFIVFLARFKKCPKGKALVIYGAKLGFNPDGTPKTVKIVSGGAAFVLPFIQSYKYLDLTPFTVKVESKNIITNKDERVNVVFSYKIAISCESDYKQNVAERLFGMPMEEIKDMTEDIVTGQINSFVSNWDSENIEKDKYKVFDKVTENISNTLKMVGLKIQRAELTDFYKVKNSL